ncbi:condensation domain-containing protein, partial [Streptococcus salivarius]|uniref:condensation domain-containing protein n=1 Tax=Streptococcus salivarius TaxID=1304 RepID=UPI0022E584B7
GKYYFKEGTINSKFKIDVLDITKWKNIDKESIKRQVETELFDYVAKMNKENNILYKFVLIKTDEKTYEFTIIFSHLISDAASANIFSKELITKYQEIMGLLNESKNDEFTYKDYLSELSNNYSKSKYLEFVNSKKYQKIKKYSNGKRNNRDLQTYILKVPNETVRNFINDNEEYTKEGILLWLSTKLAKIILAKEKIAYRITNSGRTVGNKKFNNVFGDCHVHYPLIINSDIDSISTC